MNKIKLSKNFIDFLKSKNCSIEEINSKSVKITSENIIIYIDFEKKFYVKVYADSDVDNIFSLNLSLMDKSYENLKDAEAHIMLDFENFKEIGFVFCNK